jgi:hypothetical protein
LFVFLTLLSKSVKICKDSDPPGVLGTPNGGPTLSILLPLLRGFVPKFLLTTKSVGKLYNSKILGVVVRVLGLP